MSKIRGDFPQTPLKLTLREEQISTILYCLEGYVAGLDDCLLYTSPSPRDGLLSRMPSSA